MLTKEPSLFDFMTEHGPHGKIDWSGLFCTDNKVPGVHFYDIKDKDDFFKGITGDVPVIIFKCLKCRTMFLKLVNSNLFYEWLQEHQLHGGKWYITTNNFDKSVSFDYICRCNERYCVKTN